MKLVVVADDLGYSIERNNGIIEACVAQGGLVTQASLLVNAKYAKEGIVAAKKNNIFLGLHLNLTEGVPVSLSSQVSSLLNDHGQFKGKHGFRESFKNGEIKLSEVELEVSSQLKAFEQLVGKRASHVDGHQHIHVFAELIPTLAKIFSENGVQSVRFPVDFFASHDTNTLDFPWIDSNCRSFYQKIIHDTLQQAISIYQSFGIIGPKYFLGMCLTSCDSYAEGQGINKLVKECLLTIMDDEENGHETTIEIMSHPGFITQRHNHRDNFILAGTNGNSSVIPQSSSNLQSDHNNNAGNDKDDGINNDNSNSSKDNNDNDNDNDNDFDNTLSNSNNNKQSNPINDNYCDCFITYNGPDDFAISKHRVHEMTVLKNHFYLPKSFLNTAGITLGSMRNHSEGKTKSNTQIQSRTVTNDHHASNNQTMNLKIRKGEKKSDFINQHLERKKKLLLLTSMTPGTGNYETALRLKTVFQKLNYLVSIMDAVFAKTDQIQDWITKTGGFSVIVAIHAYRAGKHLIALDSDPSKIVIVLGGTDMNVMIHDEQKLPIICQAIAKAHGIVSFHSKLSEKKSSLPSSKVIVDEEKKNKCFIIPQAVSQFVDHNYLCSPSDSLLGSERNGKDKISAILRKKFNLGPKGSDRLLILPAGIRPVKDPLYLLDAIKNWRRTRKDIYLIIVGPLLDQNYGLLFKKALNLNDNVDSSLDPSSHGFVLEQMEMLSTIGVTWHPAIDHEQLILEIDDSDILINSSLEEGMSNSILEAMSVKTPVLARRNTGNENLIVPEPIPSTRLDNKTMNTAVPFGWIYDDPDQFQKQAIKIFESPDDANIIVDHAYQFVLQNHSLKQELASWKKVLESL